jgi:signal transduction histidine kinase
VRCFEGEIRQVLSNLVSNAIDATPPMGGGRLLLRSRVGTDWKTGRLGLVISVADNGSSGMPASVVSRIFEAFYATKGANGTGLGLWVSSEIVERHQGILRVRSSQKPGRSGTAFALFLPFDAVSR